MKRLISSITLCLGLLSCVETPEERTAFKKEVEALRLATEVLPGEIARLKAELEATKKSDGDAFSLSGVNEHALSLPPNALRNLNLEYKARKYDTSFLDWAADQSLLQYPIYETIRMDEGYENYFDNACPSVFTREHLHRAKAIYQLNGPVLKFLKNLIPNTGAARHRFLEPFIATLVPDLIIHHQQIVAFADWEEKLSKLYLKAEAGELPSLQDFVDAGFPAGPNSECEEGVGWDETRAWFYGFWMRRHADGTFKQVERLLRTLTNYEGLSVVARRHTGGCIAPFTYRPDGCVLSLDWDDDGKVETLTLVGPNLRIVHQDDTIPTRSYPWGYRNAARWNQRVTYQVIPSSKSGVPLLAVTSTGLEAHTGTTNTYYAYHPSRGPTLAAQENQGSDPPVWRIETVDFSPDKTLVLTVDEGEDRDEYLLKESQKRHERLTQECTDACDTLADEAALAGCPEGEGQQECLQAHAKSQVEVSDHCYVACEERALEREGQLDGAGFQNITKSTLCFKEGRYVDCNKPAKATPTDCIACPEALPQCEEGCEDCLITSSSCKTCASAECLKASASDTQTGTGEPSTPSPATGTK